MRSLEIMHILLYVYLGAGQLGCAYLYNPNAYGPSHFLCCSHTIMLVELSVCVCVCGGGGGRGGGRGGGIEGILTHTHTHTHTPVSPAVSCWGPLQSAWPVAASSPGSPSPERRAVREGEDSEYKSNCSDKSCGNEAI